MSADFIRKSLLKLPTEDKLVVIKDITPVVVVDYNLEPATNPGLTDVVFKVEFNVDRNNGAPIFKSEPIITDGISWVPEHQVYTKSGRQEMYKYEHWIIPSHKQFSEAIDKILCGN